MKRVFFLLILITFTCNISLFAQEKSANKNQLEKNLIYETIGINPIDYYIPLFINYERNIYDAGFIKFYGRTGIGLWKSWTGIGFNLPVTLQTVLFKKASHLELGIGGQCIFGLSGDIYGLSHVLNIAYRIQKPGDKSIFKIGIEKSNLEIYPFFGFGYAF